MLDRAILCLAFVVAGAAIVSVGSLAAAEPPQKSSGAKAGELTVEVYKTTGIAPPGDVQSVAELVTAVLLPESWDALGGQGTLSFEGDKMVVRQTVEGHALIRSLFTQLRSLPKRKEKAAAPVPKKLQIPVGKYVVSDKTELQVTIYPVGDLLENDGSKIIDTITRVIDPDSWSDSGGWGEIKPNLPHAVLVVAHTPKVQAEIAKLLAKLRTQHFSK